MTIESPNSFIGVRGQSNAESKRRWLAVAVVLLASCGGASLRSPIGYEAPPTTPNVVAIQRMFTDRLAGNVRSQGAQTDDGVQVVLQAGHTQQLTSTAMSADGREILTGAFDGTVKLWDVASGQEVRTFSGFSSGMMVAHATFDATGRRVVIGDGLQTYLFDATTGRREQTLSGGANGFAFNGATVIAPGARYAATTNDSAMRATSTGVQVIELATGSVVWSTPVEDNQTPLALSDDGNVLLIRRTKIGGGFFGGANVRMDVQVWDAGAKRPRGPLPFLNADDATRGITLVLSPNGRYVLAQRTTEPTRLYTLDQAQPIATLTSSGDAAMNFFAPAAFSADGSLALQATGDGTVSVWKIPSGELLRQFPGTAASFGPNNRTLVLGLDGVGAPVLHDLDSGTNTPLTAGAVAVWALTALPGGRSAATTMQDGSTRLWDLATGQMQRNFDCPDGTGATSVASSGDGAVAISCSDGSVWQWPPTADSTPHRLVAPVLTPAGPTALGARSHVRFFDAGRRFAVARDRMIIVYDAADGRELRRIEVPPGSLVRSNVTFDAATLNAMSKQEREVYERSEASQADPKNQAMMQAMADNIEDFDVHPNGRWLVVARQNDIGVWDIESGAFLRKLGGPPALDQSAAAQAGSDAPTSLLGRIGQGSGSGASAKRLQAIMEQVNRNGGGMPNGYGGTHGDSEDEYLASMFAGAQHAVFRSDGALLTTGGISGAQLWDVSTGSRMRTAIGHGGPRALMSGNFDADSLSDTFENVSEGIFSPDGRVVALAAESVIYLQDAATGAELALLRGHRSRVAAMAFTPDGQRLLSGGADGTLRIWSVPRAVELAQLIALGHSDYVAVTPDQYYRASKSRIKGVAFRVKDQIYPFEQFDLRFNRPDIVLERLGLADPEAIDTYRQSYQRRLKKLGFTEAMLGADFHLPSVEIATADVPVTTDTTTVSITIDARDDKYALDRLQVFVNDVPVFGTRGIALEGDQQDVRKTVDVPLVAGRNKIQVSALNRQGAESLRQTAYTTATGKFPPGDIYVVTVGVSKYSNAAYNLRYAAKDAGDFASVYSTVVQGATEGNVHVLSLTNERATRDEIRAAKGWLRQAKIGDLAIVFAAGHGMTDPGNNYYFGTFDIDPQNPSARGLPYEDFEALLDGIAPLRKMLLIDTCFSGEIDKDDAVIVGVPSDGTQGQVSMRAFKAQRGVQVVADDAASAANATVVRFQQDWFADLRRGTGAVVISSASGNEYAFEGEQWNNGVFTYALLQGLKNGAADTDHDQRITVGELQSYVIEQVRKLTAGGQNPTVRRENLDYDFEVY